MLQFSEAGYSKEGRALDVRTQNGAFAGVISESYTPGKTRVWFNSTATRGSARRFQDANAALEYIIARRTKRGWRI